MWQDGKTTLESGAQAQRLFGRNLLLPDSGGPITQAAAKIAEIINNATIKGKLPAPQQTSASAAKEAYNEAAINAELAAGNTNNYVYEDYSYEKLSKDERPTHYGSEATADLVYERYSNIFRWYQPEGSERLINNATFVGGDGRDFVAAGDNVTASTGGGNDGIHLMFYATVDSGDGDDTIHVEGGGATITAGEGNDYILVETGASTIDAGSGDDTIRAGFESRVIAGDGNDEIRGYQYTNADAGDGDDLAVVFGYSTVRGGAGNDTLIESEAYETFAIYGHSQLEGGEGDDYIQASIGSTVTGGTGNDVIRLMNKDATIIFNKGDGQDVIMSREDLTVKIGGYSKDDVIISQDGDMSIVSFKGSDEKIVFDLGFGANAHLAFEDGSTMDVDGSTKKKHLSYVVAKPDSNPESDNQFYYSAGAATVSRDRLASSDGTVFGRDNGKPAGL